MVYEDELLNPEFYESVQFVEEVAPKLHQYIIEKVFDMTLYNVEIEEDSIETYSESEERKQVDFVSIDGNFIKRNQLLLEFDYDLDRYGNQYVHNDKYYCNGIYFRYMFSIEEIKSILRK